MAGLSAASGAGLADRRDALVVAGTAIALRLFLLAGFTPSLTPDSASYLDLARRLAVGHLAGYPATRTPGYPALLVLAGRSPQATWWIQAGLGVVTALLVLRLLQRLGVRRGLALAGGLFAALDLEAAAYEHIVLTETLARCLLVLAALLAVEILDRRPATDAALPALGAVLAVTCLVRPDTLALTVYLAVAVAVALTARTAEPRGGGRAPAWGAVARRSAFVLILPAIALGGWAAVNRAATGVTTVSTVLGFNLIDHVGADVRVHPGPDARIEAAYVAARGRRLARTGDLSNLSYEAVPAMERASGLGIARLSGRLLSIATGVIAAHPLGYVGSSIRQWPRYFLPPNEPDTLTGGPGTRVVHLVWRAERALIVLVEIVFLAFAAWQAVSLVRRRRGPLPRAGTVLAGVVPVGLLVATFLAFGESGRYASVLVPIMVVVAIVGAHGLLGVRRPVRHPSLQPLRAGGRHS